jgi:hypothetical protein
MTCRDYGLLVGRKRCRNPICYAVASDVGGRNRAQHARFPVPGADSVLRSLRRDVPWFPSQRQGLRFASELAYHSQVAHSREPVLSEGPLCCALFGRDCMTVDALTRSALTEIPSPPVSHRICSRISKTRLLIGTSRRPSVSCCLAQRSRGFADPGSRYAFGRVLFRSSFLCRASR